MALVIGALGSGPAFYAERRPVGGPLDGRTPEAAATAAEQDARRLVTTVAALEAALRREGGWEAAIAERELNAWLALDLPRNHPGLLPALVTQPRVQLLPGRVRLAARLGMGWLAATGSLEMEVRLRSANQLGITLVAARLGMVPVPGGPVLQEIGRRVARLGAVVETRRLEDRTVLVVYILPGSGPGRWLESFTIGAGELAFAGETRGGAAPGR